MKKYKIILWLLICILLCACAKGFADSISSNGDTVSGNNQTTGGEAGSTVTPATNIVAQTDGASYGAWVVYWDNDMASNQLTANANQYDTICHFAAYFDINKNLFIPEEVLEFLNQQNNSDALKNKESYLTIVNDLIIDGGSSLKDTDLLYEIFKDQSSIDSHVNSIISLAVENDFDGIEIDYERIRKDMTLWGMFINFENTLIEKASAYGLKVRVVLEPGIPFDSIDFPAGAEYVIMCYNLYGYSAEAGPKADYAFLGELVDKSAYLPGNTNFALANGGFRFSEDGATGLTYDQAVSLADEYGAEVTRDDNSGALYFSFTENGKDYQVWYADDVTIELWVNYLEQKGCNRFTLWRIM